MKRFSTPLFLFLASVLTAWCAQAQQSISIDAHGATTPFPHFWETMFGSGRAALVLRGSYMDDLRAVLDEEIGRFG